MILIIFGVASKVFLKITTLSKLLNLKGLWSSHNPNISGGIYRFNFSNDDFKFAEMPDPRWDYAAAIQNNNDFFTGQHEKIIIKTADHARLMSALGGEMVVKQKNVT